MIQWHLLSPAKMAALGLLGSLLVLVFSLFYFVGESSVYLFDWEVFSIFGVSFFFPVLLDKISLLFSSVVVLISFSVMLFTVTYMSGDSNLEYFIYMVVLFVLSMNFLIFIPHLFMLLLGWDGLGLTSYILVIYYQNDSSLAAGMVTALSNRIGDSLLIMCTAWSLISGHWSHYILDYNVLWFVMLCVVIGAMTKSAQIPFSAWLPAAMAAPTPVSSLVHSSTLVTAGVYLLFRFYVSLNLYAYFSLFIFYSGVVTCLMASLSAIYENDLKKIIALSTLSQLGVMMIALGLSCPMLAFFHLVTHALFKALLFICAGTIIHMSQNNQDIRLMGNVWSLMPVTCASLNVANLALCGFPFMAGFYSKDLIVESFMFSVFPISTSILLMLSVCLTSAYTVRLCMYSLWGVCKSGSVLLYSDESLFTYLACFILLLGAVFGGALFSWFLLPLCGVLILPVYLKVLTLVLVFFFGFGSYLLVESNFLFSFFRFMGSMWFLGFITTSPLLGWSFSLGDLLYKQELTWMELFSGKGAYGVFVYFSGLAQRTQNLSFSYLFSMITAIFVLSFLFF